MPTAGTSRHAFRIDDADWRDFGDATGNNRSAVLRGFVAWYLRRSKAKLPTRVRPDYTAPSTQEDTS